MKYIKNFENSIRKHDSDIIESILADDIEQLKICIKRGDDINYKQIGDNLTPLMFAAYYFRFDMLSCLIDAGADWYCVDSARGEDFIDILKGSGELYYIIDNYPEKYEEYLINKETKKYNL